MGVEPTLAADLLRGAAAIAAYTGLTERSVYHAAERGSLPIRRVAGLGLVARKSALDAFFASPAPVVPIEAPRRTRNPRAAR